jgi:hypothetical protein
MRIGDILVAGDYNSHCKQYFYVFDIIDKTPLMHGISKRHLFNATYVGWSTNHIADATERQEFYDLLDMKNCVVDVNLKTIREKYKRY